MTTLLLVLALLCDLSRLGVTPEQAAATPVTVTTMRQGYTWQDLQTALFGRPLFVIRYHRRKP